MVKRRDVAKGVMAKPQLISQIREGSKADRSRPDFSLASGGADERRLSVEYGEAASRAWCQRPPPSRAWRNTSAE